MAKVTFTKDFLVDTLDLPGGKNEVHSELVGRRRWSLDFEIIFTCEGKFYKTYYSRGATEYQDNGPWEFEDELECEEVHQVEKLVKVWEAKPGVENV